MALTKKESIQSAHINFGASPSIVIRKITSVDEDDGEEVNEVAVDSKWIRINSENKQEMVPELASLEPKLVAIANTIFK